MAIQGAPRNGAILMCDFSQHENELVGDGNMTKTRQVVVISPQHQRRGKILRLNQQSSGRTISSRQSERRDRTRQQQGQETDHHVVTTLPEDGRQVVDYPCRR